MEEPGDEAVDQPQCLFGCANFDKPEGCCYGRTAGVKFGQRQRQGVSDGDNLVDDYCGPCDVYKFYGIASFFRTNGAN